jgi:hypothetical protein
MEWVVDEEDKTIPEKAKDFEEKVKELIKSVEFGSCLKGNVSTVRNRSKQNNYNLSLLTRTYGIPRVSTQNCAN